MGCRPTGSGSSLVICRHAEDQYLNEIIQMKDGSWKIYKVVFGSEKLFLSVVYCEMINCPSY